MFQIPKNNNQKGETKKPISTLKRESNKELQTFRVQRRAQNFFFGDLQLRELRFQRYHIVIIRHMYVSGALRNSRHNSRVKVHPP